MRLAVEIEGQESEQHQNAAEKRIKKKLDGRIFAPRPAPDADEEVHGQQHEFPENIEEEKIQGDEYAHHAGIKQEKERKVSFHGLVNSPGGEDAQETEQRGQEHHGDAETIDAHKVFDVRSEERRVGKGCTCR